VAQAPSANFTANSTAGCFPFVVTFQDLSSNNPTSWLWDFGNGATSTAKNPTTTFFNPGSYTIKLTVTNLSGSNTLTRTGYITVYESPTVNFMAVDSAGCFPLRSQFTDQSVAGTGSTISSWEWNFGDGATASDQHPLHIYNASGNFSVTLKVTNDKGCSKVFTRPQYIKVNQGVDAKFSNSSPAVCRPPTNISFTNTSTGPGTMSYLWDFGDGGTTNQANPIHAYTTPGNYTVTLVAVSDLGCRDTVQTVNAVVIDTVITVFSIPDSICVRDSLVFQNTSTPSPQNAFWNFGDGTTSALTNPLKSYSTAGVYTVRLTNSYGFCQDSAVKTIAVINPPGAGFTADRFISCQPPLTVSFQDLSTGNAVGWFWDFGDGATSTEQNPVHTYTTYGIFTVTLVATNPTGCNDTISKAQFIKIAKPTINFPEPVQQGCIPFAVNFAPTIHLLDTVITWFWDFGDGTTSTLANPSHTYTSLGTFTATGTITTSTGCTESRSITVKAGTLPSVDFSYSTTATCVDQPVQFTDLSSSVPPVNDWLWDFGDGAFSTLKNPTHQYPTPGIYTVKLIARNSGCPDSSIKTDLITILSPQAYYTYMVNCGSRTDFTFTDKSDSSSSWFWNFGDGTTSTVQNPSHSFPGLGIYNVSLTVTYGSCTHTYAQNVRVLDENPDIQANPNPVCRNTTDTLTALNINTSNISTYNWNFGDGVILNGPKAVAHTYLNAGNYSVTLITTDLNGCKDTITKTDFLRVNGPVADFTTLNSSGCTGLNPEFNDLSASDGTNNIVNWKWDFGDGTVQNFSSAPFTHTYNNVGSYSVSLVITDAAGCSDSTGKVNYITTTDPSVTFSTSSIFACPGARIVFDVKAEGEGLTYLWDFGDGGTSVEAYPNPPHIYTTPGKYTVKLTVTDSYGCSDSLVRDQYVTVDRPVADFTMNDSVSSCTPFEVQFTNKSSYYYAQRWDFGDGDLSTLQNPTHYFNTPGTYTVKLVITSPGTCFDSITKIVTLYDTAGTRISYSPLGGCKPQTVNFSAQTNGPVTYLWDFGDGETVTSINADTTHQYNSFGIFVPKLILQDPTGCLIPVTGIDTIRIKGADANFGADKYLLCDNGLINFIDSSVSNDAIVSYNWDFGDGGTSSQQTPSYFYTSTGLYSVTLALRTQSGCTDTLRKTDFIRVVSRPWAEIISDTAVCVFSPLSLAGNLLQPDTSAVTWNWSFGNGNSSTAQNPSPQVYNSPGNVMASLITENSSGCRDTVLKNLRIHPLPTVSLPVSLTINAGYSVILPAVYSGNMTDYLWSPSTYLSCSDCPQPDAAPHFTTQYQVEFTDSNSCKGTGSLLIKVKCENTNVFMPNTFSPNADGNNDIFYPRGIGIEYIKALRVFNRWGEIVFERNNFSANNPSMGWDGTYKGKPANNDVYVYQLELYCLNGDLIRFDGNIALIR